MSTGPRSSQSTIADRLVEQYDRYPAEDRANAGWTLSPLAWEKVRIELNMAIEPTTILGLPARIDPDLPDSVIMLDRWKGLRIDRITRAVDTDGQEWVPAGEYRRERAEAESLKCLTVNPRRNVYRAMRALTEDKDIKRALYFLEHAADELDRAYETAFPPKVVA